MTEELKTLQRIEELIRTLVLILNPEAELMEQYKKVNKIK